MTESDWLRPPLNSSLPREKQAFGNYQRVMLASGIGFPIIAECSLVAVNLAIATKIDRMFLGPSISPTHKS